ncbi:MAG: DUF4150 domain-containing protein [Leptolyngbya sp. PLA3]|nr:MAG: DUF4150 domain-containing protein [Cyanobacteria bacterium CYA]MCE7967143.1 DUF4150 domain-containing protein [Leptolyngbya sp. PL-A3]
MSQAGSPAGAVPIPYPNLSTSQAGAARFSPKADAILVRGSQIPVSLGDEAGTSGGVSSGALQEQASAMKSRAIAFNPKLDPKYDARAGRDVVFIDPRAGKGQSLIGHELTHVVQQR